MQNILDNIVRKKIEEVRSLYIQRPCFDESIQNRTYTRSLVSNINRANSPGIIAEFKRQSPSKGIISTIKQPLEVVKQYEKAGAVAASILTDELFFGGTLNDIISLRDQVNLPILRKDFIIDKIQIDQAAAAGADIILLIASILTKEEIYDFTSHAHQIGLEVLLEVHDVKELEKACTEVDLLGVNNRDLKTFDIDYDRSIKLLDMIDNHFISISESGLSDTAVVSHLYQKGFKGFLMGENFMKHAAPGVACKTFIDQLR
ncbi:indole-3-glycerol phosphate synthase TrpC [Halosquirtibacter xylanolyticus]|uniref:indole-3-glycerol phosphate synthase TrpC n=1 Tax=Halosquirtibacter xylanolyticus TaxID=3374599 RepID=UPI00374872BD|nr:indole-3-glycerol phosphate synthase TrpC [Prolixibacteraceae bacterium]